jgi:hypothetical protein
VTGQKYWDDARRALRRPAREFPNVSKAVARAKAEEVYAKTRGKDASERALALKGGKITLRKFSFDGGSQT